MVLVLIRPSFAKYKIFAILDPIDVADISCLTDKPDTFEPKTTVRFANSNTGFDDEDMDLERLISKPNFRINSKYSVATSESKITKSSPRIS